MGRGEKITRQLRRQQAMRDIKNLSGFKEYRVNDAHCAHVTFWRENGARVEWWPGSQMWMDADGERHSGHIGIFSRWLKETDDRSLGDDFSVLEDE